MPHEWETLAADPEIKPLLDVNYMRHAERQSEAGEIATIERKLTDPVERRFLQNPGKLQQQTERRKHNLQRQSPPDDLRPSQKDKLLKLEAVTRAFCRENMPTAEAMRHNPPGTVDHHIAWEAQCKPALIVWKRTMILLNPASPAMDLANFEKHRPSAATRNLYPDGTIPGKFALSTAAKQNYDGIDWSSPPAAMVALIQDLVDRGFITVRGDRAYRPKPVSPAAQVCSEPGCGRVYRGKHARQSLAGHVKKAHVREEAAS